MKPRDQALRAQDIEAGLHGTSNLPSFASSEFKRTFLVGKAARLATHIGGAEVFEESDIGRLEAVADSLGIEPLILPRVLRVMEEANMVTVATKGDEILRVRENIPKYGDLYEKLGEYYAAQQRSETEVAVIESFHTLVEAPRIDDESLPIQILDEKHRAPLIEATDQAGLIRFVKDESGNPIAFSPQHWDEHTQSTHALLLKYGHDGFKKIRDQLIENPGVPLNVGGVEVNVELARELAHAGVLPSPSVEGLKGKADFAFLPYKGFNEDPAIESKLVEKVRALISCVRYGQHFGTGSKIKYPAAILRAFRDKKNLNPHTDHYTQYKLLYDRGMVRLEKLKQNSQYFVTTFIDTEENMRALNAAISLLEVGTPVEATEIIQDVRNYAISASYEEPVIVRAKRKVEYTKSTQATIFNAIRDIIT